MTNERQWRAVDAYLAETIVKQDGALDAALAESEEAGLPPIEVSPPHAKMLHLIARLMGARKALEIGTLGGYSTIWIARALPEDGRVVTLEADERHAKVARRNLIRAGLSGKVSRTTPAWHPETSTRDSGTLGVLHMEDVEVPLPKNDEVPVVWPSGRPWATTAWLIAQAVRPHGGRFPGAFVRTRQRTV